MTASDRGARRVALVTGASSGVGKVIAVRLGSAGMHVVVSSHNAERAGAVIEEIRAAGGEASLGVADLLDPTQVKSLVDDVVAAHGRIDHLVASGAGASTGVHFKVFHEIDPGALLGIIQAQWLSRAYLLRAALDHMIPAGYGKVVLISTDAGRTPTVNESMIGGAGAGTMAMARAVAREVGRYGVRVNTIACGPLSDLDLTLLVTEGGDGHDLERKVADKLKQRMLFPVDMHDLAETALFLLEPTGDHITGQVWSVNGGVSMP